MSFVDKIPEKLAPVLRVHTMGVLILSGGHMKHMLLAATVAAVAVFGQTASAGSLTETTIVEDASSSSSGEATVLLLALMFALAVSD